MFKSIRRLGALAIAGILAATVFTVATPGESAEATGSTAYALYENVQINEQVPIYTDDPCIDLDPNYPSTRVSAILRPSDNSGDIIAYAEADLDANGVWNKGYISIPSEAFLGSYEVILTCEDNWGLINMVYDAFSINIVDNNVVDVTVDSTKWLHEATFTSISSACSNDEAVKLELYGTLINSETYDYETYVRKTVPVDNNGGWLGTFELTPSTGSDNFEWNMNYFLRATCLETGTFLPKLTLNSFSFQVTDPQYVALGDSYSSGTGTGNYDLDTTCYRSSDTYSYYVSWHEGWSTPDLAACHGAVTDDVVNALTGQIGFVSEETYRISLTIGGNDAGFSDVMEACSTSVQNLLGYGCSTRTDVTDPVQDVMLALDGKWGTTPLVRNGKPIHSIKSVLTELHEAAPNASIYIAGYPEFFGNNTSNFVSTPIAPSGYKCVVNTGSVDLAEVSIDYDDAQWINSRAVLINGIIEDAVIDLSENEDLPVYYVPLTPYDTHGLCDVSDPWLRDIELADMAESFHPNMAGYTLGYGQMFTQAMGLGD